MKSGVLTIVLNEDRSELLLIKRDDIPVFVLPGGGIDEFETPEDAAIRETLEETGFEVTLIRKTGEYTPLNRLGALTHVFEAQVKKGRPTVGAETKEVGFFPLKELPKSFFILHQDLLEDALKNEMTVKKPLTRLTYTNLFLFFLKHPLLIFYALLARLKKGTNER